MIEVDQLAYVHRSGVSALKGLSVALERGQWTALIGPNGSGKTTLARCLNGLLMPTSGSVRVDGLTLDEDSLPEIRRRIGMVFQNPDDQLVGPTVETDIAFGLENHGVAPAEMRLRMAEVLSIFRLESLRHHPPHLLSGGERQRLAVASAVAVCPNYLILDEPTALLDPQSRAELMDLISRLCSDQGLGVLHITQAPAEAARAGRVLVLHEGNITADAPPRRIFGQRKELAAIGLSIPFAVDVAMAAGGDAEQVLNPEELSAWLVGNFVPPTSGAPVAESPAGQTGTKLRTEALYHVYRVGVPAPIQALQDVTIGIPAGSISALIGPSGSGKTTLVQHFNALLRPSAGVVCLDERDIWSDGDGGEARRQVGLVFQFPEAQMFEETVAADVAFGPRNHGCSAAETAVRTEDALATVGLPVALFGNRAPQALSGGERRRAAIAGVLAIAPAVIVFDEPTAGLDPANEQIIADLLTRLAAEGCSVVLVSHDMDRVAELASQVTVLENGRVRWHGPTRRVLEAACVEQEAGRALVGPAPLQLSLDLRKHGWHVPAMLTRGEACSFVSGLQRRTVEARARDSL